MRQAMAGSEVLTVSGVWAMWLMGCRTRLELRLDGRKGMRRWRKRRRECRARDGTWLKNQGIAPDERLLEGTLIIVDLEYLNTRKR